MRNLLIASAIVILGLAYASSPIPPAKPVQSIDRDKAFQELDATCRKLCEPHNGILEIHGPAHPSCLCQDNTFYTGK